MDAIIGILEGINERRTIEVEELTLEKREGGDDSELPRITGFTAVYNRLSLPLGFLGGFREKIKPGAFTKSLESNTDIPALANHDSSRILGRTSAGTLELMDRQRGLRFVADPPPTTWARDLVASIDRGDITGSSFEFRAIKDKWITRNDEEDPDNNETIREVHEAELVAIAPAVTFPAYPDATTSLRSILGSLGVDLEGLAGIVTSRSRGVGISAAERDLIKATTEALWELAHDKPEDVAGRAVLDSARRELELAEILN